MSRDDFDPRFDPAFQPGFVGEPTTQSNRHKNPARQALEAAREQAERAPLSITLGVAIIAGLLFMYASAWQRRV